MECKFRIGDRVIVTKPYDDTLDYEEYPLEVGDVGTVVTMYDPMTPGVRFDRDFGGHDLSGSCENGHGLWFSGGDGTSWCGLTIDFADEELTVNGDEFL